VGATPFRPVRAFSQLLFSICYLPFRLPAMSNPTRILLIDDDRKFAKLMTDYLAPFGYEVSAEHTGTAGVARAVGGGTVKEGGEQWAAIILDLMLPEIDGFEVLRRVRQRSQVPVLMLTARGDETDRIVGLEIGADDYVPKTSSPRELLARLRAVLRRTAQQPAAYPARPPEDAAGGAKSIEDFVIGELHINIPARSAVLGTTALVLTPVEFDLLVCLARVRGRVKSRNELLDEIRGRDYEVFDRSIDVHISSLRRKLGDDPKVPRYIRTFRTVGYALRAPEDETPAG